MAVPVRVRVTSAAAPEVAGGLRASVRLRRGTLDLDVSVAVDGGSTVAVLGPNGAGKTTLLRALAGLVPLAAGSVTLAGRVLEDVERRVRVAPEERGVGVVFQDYRLFPHLTAVDNVAFGLRSTGVGRTAARSRAQGWLDRMGVGHVGPVRPGRLSGGEAQRVALARALAGEPRLLLLDEPLAALDAGTRPEVRRELRRHLASFTGACLVVTHDPLEAVTLGDHVAMLEAGRVVQEGTPSDITARPRTRYVADLAGANLFEGEAAGDRVDLPGGGSLVATDAGTGPVFAVVDPRAVSLHRRRPEGTPRNVWTARIEEVDRLGDHVRVRLGGPVPVVAEVTPAAAADLALTEGADVWVSLKASQVKVYPA